MPAALLLSLSLAAAAPTLLPTTIQDVQVTSAAAAPGQFAYKVTAKILVGGNACQANGVTVDLVRKIDDGVLELVPTKRLPPGPPAICAQSYAPVYAVVQRLVTGSVADTEDVVLLNVAKLGTRTPVQDFLATAPSSSLTGVLEQVMAAGGETTGYGLELQGGQMVELDLKTNGFERRAVDLFNQSVTVSGVYKSVTGVELTRQVFEVTSLEPR